MKIPEQPRGQRVHHYHLEVLTENYIPHDVLIEHLAVAMRDLRFLGKNSIALRGTDTSYIEEPKVARQHPFDGPEVFDDYVGPELSGTEYVFTAEQIKAMGGVEALEKLQEISNRLMSDSREMEVAMEKLATPKGGTHSEGGFTPVDPYPLTTRVIDKIKETRRHGND